MRPGRHGSMSSGEFEQILVRNANFLSVRRAGSGDGYAGLYNGVTGDFVLGITPGTMPEYSHMTKLTYNCECSPRALCKRAIHGSGLVRGWRNILFELAARGRVRVTNEIVRTLGEEDTVHAVSKLLTAGPGGNPAPAWEYSSL